MGSNPTTVARWKAAHCVVRAHTGSSIETTHLNRTFERFRWSPLRRVSLEKGGVRSDPNPEKMDKRALSGREKDPSRWITVVIRSVVKCAA